MDAANQKKVEKDCSKSKSLMVLVLSAIIHVPRYEVIFQPFVFSVSSPTAYLLVSYDSDVSLFCISDFREAAL